MSFVTAERKTYSGPSGEISYLSEGSGAPMVMLHGLLSNAVDYHFQFKHYSSRRLCMALDMRGCGMSKTGDGSDATIETTAEDVIDFVTEIIPIKQKFILVGHSFGGLTALEVMSRIPERLEAVVIISSPAAISKKAFARATAGIAQASFPILRPILTNQFILKIYSRYININPGCLTGELKSILKERNAMIGDGDLRAMLSCLASVKDWSFSPPSGAEDVPVALIYGNRDPMFEKRDIDEFMEKLPWVQRYLVKGAGHSCMQEMPDEFNMYMDSFLSTLSGRG